jgi:hypothetical protein
MVSDGGIASHCDWFRLNIETTKLQIIIANLGFRDKVNIINTFVGVNPYFDNADKKAYKKKFRALRQYANTSRNMIAHAPFKVDANKTGVHFDKVQASGTFNVDGEIWDTKKFQGEVTIVNEYRAFIEQVGIRFAQQPLPEQAFKAAAAQRASYYDSAPWLWPGGGMPAVLRDWASRNPEKDDPS